MNRRTCCQERLLTPEIYRMLQYTTFCCFFLLFCGRPKESAILIYVQVSITNACHIHMQPVVWTSFKNEWNALKAIWWRASGPSFTWNLRKAQRWPGKERLHLSCPRTLILFITSFNLGSYSNFYYYYYYYYYYYFYYYYYYYFYYFQMHIQPTS